MVQWNPHTELLHTQVVASKIDVQKIGAGHETDSVVFRFAARPMYRRGLCWTILKKQLCMRQQNFSLNCWYNIILSTDDDGDEINYCLLELHCLAIYGWWFMMIITMLFAVAFNYVLP